MQLTEVTTKDYDAEELTDAYLSAATKMKRREATVLLQRLKSGKFDALTVVKLLGFYEPRYLDNLEYEIDRQWLILWMIKEMSSHPFLCRSLPLPIKSLDPGFYRKVKSRWIRLCRTANSSSQTLLNAAAYLLKDETLLAEKYIARAQELEPENPALEGLRRRLEAKKSLRLRNLRDRD